MGFAAVAAVLAVTLVVPVEVADYTGDALLPTDGSSRWPASVQSPCGPPMSFVDSDHEVSQSCLVGYNDE